MTTQELNKISGMIVDSAIKVHRFLGPGLLETACRKALVHELRKRGLKVEVEVPIHVQYDGEDLGETFRADMIVENEIIVELKSIEELGRVHKKQITTYIRLANRKIGLLINFGAELIKDGIVRVVYELAEDEK